MRSPVLPSPSVSATHPGATPPPDVVKVNVIGPPALVEMLANVGAPMLTDTPGLASSSSLIVEPSAGAERASAITNPASAAMNDLMAATPLHNSRATSARAQCKFGAPSVARATAP